MGEEETIWAAVGALKAWISVREPNAGGRLRGEVPVTQFGRMCERLGIKIVAATCPQAKGRVERNHGTHQDRLVKKMWRRKIGRLGDANRYLKEEYGEGHNARFAAAEQDYHLPSPRGRELEKIFRLERERVLSNDWVVRDANRFYQVERQSREAWGNFYARSTRRFLKMTKQSAEN